MKLKAKKPFPRTIMVRDFKASANGLVVILSCDGSDLYYYGSVSDIPFVYLDCWVASLALGYYYELDESVCPFFWICLES